MIFSNKWLASNDDVKINDVVIEHVECTKFLGVLIDNKRRWKEYISKLKGKSSKVLLSYLDVDWRESIKNSVLLIVSIILIILLWSFGHNL